jgi:hypothetical protein
MKLTRKVIENDIRIPKEKRDIFLSESLKASSYIEVYI